MSRIMRGGTDGVNPVQHHYHIWQGVLNRYGVLTQRNRIGGYWRTRSSAKQWLRKAGRRGAARPRVEQCEDLGICRAKPFDAKLQHKSSTVNRLTQGLVDHVTQKGFYCDGGGLNLGAHVTKDGGLVRRWCFKARLQVKTRHIPLGSAEVVTLEEARVVAAEIRQEFVERRRLLKEGDDGDETNAAFLARMEQIAADAVEGEDNGA